jgi:hypothetical protein
MEPTTEKLKKNLCFQMKNAILNQEEVTVKDLHFIQEDSPDEIGRSIVNFIQKISS